MAKINYFANGLGLDFETIEETLPSRIFKMLIEDAIRREFTKKNEGS